MISKNELQKNIQIRKLMAYDATMFFLLRYKVDMEGSSVSNRVFTILQKVKILIKEISSFTTNQNDHRQAFILLINKNPVGYIEITDENKLYPNGVVINENNIEIMRIGILPQFRRKGLALMLLHYVETLAIQRGINTIWVEYRFSNTRAKTLYKRFGLKSNFKYFDKNGEAWELMIKTIM